MFDQATDLLVSLKEFITPLLQYAVVLYQEWWINPLSLFLASAVMYYYIFAFEYRMNGGSKTIWKGLCQEMRFFGPGGTKLRIELLKNVFFDWQECLQGDKPRCSAGGWNSLDFGIAYQDDDQVTLYKMSRLFGSGWYTWIVRPIVALLLALVLPPFIVFFVPLMLFISILLLIFSSRHT